MIYRVVQELSSSYGVRLLCTYLGVSKSGYYRYINGQSYSPSIEKVDLLSKVAAIFKIHKKRYGARRIQAVLEDEGINIGIYRVRSLMREQGLIALQPKKFVPRTTQSDPSLIRSPNLLLDENNLPRAPDRVLVGDITYLPAVEQGQKRWYYLAIWMDLFTRKLVGWQLDRSMGEGLVIKALESAIQRQELQQGLIVHSDGGGQYASNNFRALLDLHSFRQSMTRKDNHYDNAFSESLFSRLKTELEHLNFTSLQQAQLTIFEYIETYYNTIRKHSSIGYKSPTQFEQLFWSKPNENNPF